MRERGIDPEVMGGSISTMMNPQRINKGYDIIDIEAIGSPAI